MYTDEALTQKSQLNFRHSDIG